MKASGSSFQQIFEVVVEFPIEVVLKDKSWIVVAVRILEDHHAPEVESLQIGKRKRRMVSCGIRILNLLEQTFEA